MCTMTACACGLGSGLVLHRLSAANVTARCVLSYARVKMRFHSGSRLFKSPVSLLAEMDRKTGEESEGPSGDFDKVAFTVPS